MCCICIFFKWSIIVKLSYNVVFHFRCLSFTPAHFTKIVTYKYAIPSQINNYQLIIQSGRIPVLVNLPTLVNQNDYVTIIVEKLYKIKQADFPFRGLPSQEIHCPFQKVFWTVKSLKSLNSD